MSILELRLIDYNFSQLSATGVTASSENPIFPASNIKNPIRSRVLRTTGNFVIDATNNKFDFNEDASHESATLVATFASGIYTPEELASEIKAKLELLSSSTFTVIYSSSTGKWTISSDGGYLELLWLTGDNSATSIGETLGFDVSADVDDALTYTGASIAIHTEESVVFDLQTTEPIDSFALLFDSIAGSKFTSSAILSLQANATDEWSAPAVDELLVIDDVYGSATFFFTSPESYRYWRLKIIDPANPFLYVEVSKIVLGNGVQLDCLPGKGFKESTNDRSSIEETAYGHRYSDIYPFRRTLELNYPGLSLADVAKLQSAFKRNGKVLPIAIAIDPVGVKYDKDQFFFYGFFQDTFVRAQVSGTKATVPVTLTEAM